MAKLADAADLKSAEVKSPVGVRFPLPAPASFFSFTFGSYGIVNLCPTEILFGFPPITFLLAR